MKIRYHKNDLPLIAKTIIENSKSKIITFKGEMGAGKTTLIKELVKSLGINDVTSSPTFSLVNQYQADNNLLVFHFDFYRINNETEAMDIGIEEYFDSGTWCFIEWPNKVKNLLPLKFDEVFIEVINDQERTIEIINHG
ncbi:MAG TPA: tRNA (adenosine(37)-N6)-threonylcarbamoyltransferase complex ATPase subunit type 1 TsaE [Flavobacteriaceae bacterium]|nr:tRNA (adenosine(37)-N6)-threonylcarbamoyltransferase complex ATPase subunit type 1 TsaE [Flavobacteriaceae bacterium]HEX5743704.1 tRNA (adenosine(37)-N6)-threonylcarbamoyltransferase complex ATPase subunit type 1 TsaE [Flavobacteriaceae bacterium]